MLVNFQSFCTFILTSISTFLTSEPMCYFIYLIIFLVIFKVFLNILFINKF